MKSPPSHAIDMRSFKCKRRRITKKTPPSCAIDIPIPEPWLNSANAMNTQSAKTMNAHLAELNCGMFMDDFGDNSAAVTTDGWSIPPESP